MIPKGVQARHPEELPSHRSASRRQKVDFRLWGAAAIGSCLLLFFQIPGLLGLRVGQQMRRPC